MITLLIGCMFSGKTTELFRLIRREQHAGKQTILFKYAKDVRYSQLASSHDGVTRDAIPIEDMRHAISLIPPGTTVVGVDEGQFIANLAEVAEELANKRGIRVIVAALDTDKNRHAWPEITRLIPMCELITKLQAVCKVCGTDAAWTRELTARESLINIGGAADYEARCRRCFAK